MASNLRVSASRSIDVASEPELRDSRLPEEVLAYVPHDGRCLSEKNRGLNHERCVLDFIKAKSQVACIVAAFYGYEDLLRHAFENGCEIYKTALQAAAAGKRLECLKFAFENYKYKRFYEEDRIMEKAIKARFLDGVKFLVSSGSFPVITQYIWEAAKPGNLEMLKVLADAFPRPIDTMQIKCVRDQECIEYLASKIERWELQDIKDAVAAKNEKLLAIILDLDSVPREVINEKIVLQGNVATAKLLFEHGFATHSMVALVAIQDGDLDYLKLLFEDADDEFDRFTAVMWSISHNNIACLKFLVENGCELVPIMIEHAVSREHIECIRYLISQKCPFTSNCTRKVVDVGRIDIADLLADNGMILEEGFSSNYMFDVTICKRVEVYTHLMTRGYSVTGKSFDLKYFM